MSEYPYYRYRITVDGCVGPILDEYPSHWEERIEIADGRGYELILERQTVSHIELAEGTVGHAFRKLGNSGILLSAWQIIEHVNKVVYSTENKEDAS